MEIKLREQCLYTLQFADDQAIIANDKEDIKYMARKLIEEYERWRLNWLVNTQRTKYLCIEAEAENLEGWKATKKSKLVRDINIWE